MTLRSIHYKYVAAGTEASDGETINVRRLEEGEEPPRHTAGDVVRLQDQREPDEPERDFEIVRVSSPMVSGFVSSDFPSFEDLYVYVTDEGFNA